MQLLKGAQCTPTAEVEHVRVSQKNSAQQGFDSSLFASHQAEVSNWKWTKSTCHKMDDINWIWLSTGCNTDPSHLPWLASFWRIQSSQSLPTGFVLLLVIHWTLKRKTTWTGASDFPKRHSGPSRSFLLRKALQPQSEGTRSKGQQVWQHTAMVSSIWATAFI